MNKIVLYSLIGIGVMVIGLVIWGFMTDWKFGAVNKKPKKGYVLFQTGYGASRLPHIGTFGEVLRTQMVMKVFNKISDIPTKLITFSDDYDALRKVPENLPNQKMLKENLGKSVS